MTSIERVVLALPKWSAAWPIGFVARDDDRHIALAHNNSDCHPEVLPDMSTAKLTGRSGKGMACLPVEVFCGVAHAVYHVVSGEVGAHALFHAGMVLLTHR